MKLVLKSISQDVSIEDPDISSASLVFEVEGTVPVGAPSSLRIPVSDDGVQAVVQFLGLVHGDEQEPGEAGLDEQGEPVDEQGEDVEPEDQDEHPDVAMGAVEFPPASKSPARFPQQQQRRPMVRESHQDEDEDGVPSL
jgi:hypothetical protein